MEALWVVSRVEKSFSSFPQSNSSFSADCCLPRPANMGRFSIAAAFFEIKAGKRAWRVAYPRVEL